MTYKFSKGDGNKIINNFGFSNRYYFDIDIIQFTNVKSNEVKYRSEKQDLIIEYGNGDSTRVLNFFRGSEYWVNEIHFADGTVVKQNQIQGLIDAQNSRSSRMIAFEEDVIVPEMPATMPLSMNVDSLQNTTDQYNQNFVNKLLIAPAMSQELHLMINAMAIFDSANNERDFMVTSESSLTQPLLTSSY